MWNLAVRGSYWGTGVPCQQDCSTKSKGARVSSRASLDLVEQSRASLVDLVPPPMHRPTTRTYRPLGLFGIAPRPDIPEKIFLCQTPPMIDHNKNVLDVSPPSEECFFLPLVSMVIMPGKLLDELASTKKTDAFEAFSIDDFVESEHSTLEGLTPEELRQRVLERTKQLAENRKFFGLRLHEALASFAEKFEAQAAERVEKALAKATAENGSRVEAAVLEAKEAERAE